MAPGRLKRRGPPLGNQNARKHGFYSSVLSPAQQSLLPRAKTMRGLNHEICVARIRLTSVVSRAPDNVRVLSAATNSLLRLERTRQDTLTRRRTADSRAANLNKKRDHGQQRDITASLPTSALFKSKTPMSGATSGSEANRGERVQREDFVAAEPFGPFNLSTLNLLSA